MGKTVQNIIDKNSHSRIYIWLLYLLKWQSHMLVDGRYLLTSYKLQSLATRSVYNNHLLLLFKLGT